MKKTLVILISITLLCALVFGGCGSSPKTIKVSGISMNDTLKNGDEVKVYPLDGMPKTGDIIAISRGEEYTNPLVKRVIAVEGQKLRIDFDNNEVYVDGKKLDEPYVKGTTIRLDLPDEKVNRVIPKNKVFVMGDNRSVSMDSRSSKIGLIDKKDIMGVIKL